MTYHGNFLRVAAIACFATVITTIGIHAIFNFDVTTFEERVSLFRNRLYLLNRWWVIVHCLLVLIAMWGVFVARRLRASGWVGLGLTFFSVFAFTEIFRQILVLFYLNGLRARYLAATDDGLRVFLTHSMDQFGLISLSLFGLFILSFALGNLCYGIALVPEEGFDRILGVLLLVWAFGTLTAFGNAFWEAPGLERAVSVFNLWFQPAMRFLIALWLWRAATSAEPAVRPARSV